MLNVDLLDGVSVPLYNWMTLMVVTQHYLNERLFRSNPSKRGNAVTTGTS